MNHLITPPPELVQDIRLKSPWSANVKEHYDYIINRAYQAGADQELEACCEWLKKGWDDVRADKLRAARRPKSPSLKEQALDALKMHFAAIGENQCYQPAHEQIIRRALEQLDD